MLTARQAAAKLGVAVNRLHRHCAALDLPRLGQAYMISESDLPRLRESLARTDGGGNPDMRSDDGQRKLRRRAQRARQSRPGTR